MFKREKRAVKTLFYWFGLNFEKPQVNSLNEGNTSSAHSNCASGQIKYNHMKKIEQYETKEKIQSICYCFGFYEVIF